RPKAPPAEILPPRIVDSRAIPRIPVEQLPDSGVPSVKGRFGDPGLSSRLSLLEMQLRRLLTCAAAKLDDSSHAPAGPGVFVLTDDDMTTYYYVEACDSLRIAISSLVRSGMTRRGNTNLKSLLANHLGIPETRVTKYLSEHCVVRWLQLDEGSVNFYHFAIAVLRPSLNEEVRGYIPIALRADTNFYPVAPHPLPFRVPPRPQLIPHFAIRPSFLTIQLNFLALPYSSGQTIHAERLRPVAQPLWNRVTVTKAACWGHSNGFQGFHGLLSKPCT